MTRPSRIGAAGLLLILSAFPFAAQTREGVAVNIVPVRKLEVGYAIGEVRLKVRVTIATGEALEFTTANAEETRVVLQLAEVFGSGRIPMTATVDGRRVRSLQLAIPAARG